MLTRLRDNSQYALPVRKYRRMRKPCRNYHHKITRRRNPPRQLTCMAQRCWNRTKLKPLAGTSKFPYTPLAELCCHLLWRGTWDAHFLLLGNTPAILTICLSLFCIKKHFLPNYLPLISAGNRTQALANCRPNQTQLSAHLTSQMQISDAQEHDCHC